VAKRRLDETAFDALPLHELKKPVMIDSLRFMNRTRNSVRDTEHQGSRRILFAFVLDDRGTSLLPAQSSLQVLKKIL
jgi:hypothetical protein